MPDRNDYLTQAEFEVLENRALRQQAKTINTYLSFAALAGMSDERVMRGLEHVRTLDKPDAKELRAKLAEVVRTLEFLGSDAPAIIVDEVVVDKITEPKPEIDVLEHFNEPDSIVELVEDTPELPEIRYESLEDAPVAEFAYLDKLFDIGKLDIREDTSVEDIAATIYEMIGRPKAGMTAAGTVPDLEHRIVRRLLGDNVEKIASEDGSTGASITTWFYQRVASRIQNDHPKDAEIIFNELLHKPRVDSSDEPSMSSAITEEHESIPQPNEYVRPAFIEKMFGDISVEELQKKTTFELATIIYEMAGSPTMYMNPSGIKPGPVKRIQQLLDGMTMKEIGELDQSSPSAMRQWFYKLEKRIQKAYPDSASDAFQQRLLGIIEDDQTHEGEPGNLEAIEEDSALEQTESYNTERFVKEFTELLSAYEDDEVLFIEQWLSANQDGHTDFAIKQYKNFAQKIGNKLPSDLSPLNISGNEKVVLRKLLGLYTQGGRRDYKDPIPVSVQLATSKDRAQTEKDIAHSIESLLDYLGEQQSILSGSGVVVEAQSASQREILKSEILSPQRTREEWLAIAQPQVFKVLAPYFEQKEITHLWNRLHFGENGEHNEQFLRMTGPALRKLEVLYVDRGGKTRAVTERSSSMLRMFTATFQGPQSLDVIYEKFARRSEERITKHDVERGIVGELSELLSD